MKIHMRCPYGSTTRQRQCLSHEGSENPPEVSVWQHQRQRALRLICLRLRSRDTECGYRSSCHVHESWATGLKIRYTN